MVFIFIRSKMTEYSNKAPRMCLTDVLLRWDVILTKDKEYAGDDPGLEGVESICFRRVCGDSIEDVDEDKKKSN